MSLCKAWSPIPFLLAASLLLLVSCSGESESSTTAEVQPSPTAQAQVWPGDDWDVSTPEAQGMDATRLEEAATYCDAHNCNAVVVTRHGRIVWER